MEEKQPEQLPKNIGHDGREIPVGYKEVELKSSRGIFLIVRNDFDVS